MNERPYYVIDAFTAERFTGNPAAVVLDAAGLEDKAMQAIAAEFNLSETTFMWPLEGPEASYRFRWFTPTMEVTLCGHATIAGVHALIETDRFPADGQDASVLNIQTRSGILSATVELLPGGNRVIWLDMPEPKLTRIAFSPAELAAALGLPKDAIVADLPHMRTQEGDVIICVRDFMVLNDARPDFALLTELSNRLRLRGWCVATTKTLAPSITVQSRFFAPAAGVNEDPVTGSVHGPLGVYLTMHGLAPTQGDLSGLNCIQAKAGGRAGLVRVLVQRHEERSYSVRIGGEAVTIMRGVVLA